MTAGRRIALIIVATALILVAMWVAGAGAEPDSRPATRRAEKVVIFGIPRLGLDDVGVGRMPVLDGLVDDGALAATSVRTLSSRASTAEAYATISAGTRVEAHRGADEAFSATAQFEGSTVEQVAERRTGRNVDGELVVINAASVVRNAGDDISSEPGALGERLRRARHETAVMSNADERRFLGDFDRHRPAALGLMDASGTVAHGRLDAGLLTDDPAAPWGLKADIGRYSAGLRENLRQADVLVVDPGDMDRALSYANLSSPQQAERQRRAALRRTDAVLGRVVEALPEDGLLLVVGLTPPGDDWALTPTLAYGAGVTPGHLHSASTRRAGLVTITDVSSTVLDALGVDEPDGMIGQPFRYRPGEVDLAGLREADDLAGAREEIYFPMALTFIVLQAVAYLILILAFTQGVASGGFTRLVRIVVLTFAAWPLAGYLLRVVPDLFTLGAGTHALVWLLALAIALASSRDRRHPLAPLAWVCGATVALLVVDVATGATLQLSSVLGYSPHTAARYTGFGNTSFAVLAATAIVLVAILVDAAPRRHEALALAAAVLTVVFVADAAPVLGADVGGILCLAPVFGLTLFVMTGRRLSWRAVGLAVVAALVLLALAIGIDLLRPEEARTHLARFVVASSSDDGTAWTTISRKWSTNLRVLQGSIWTWMVPIMSAVMLYVLVVAKGWRRMLPPGSPLRAGVVGTLAAGTIGWLVNDSGVVVTALIFVFIGPFLTLLALHSLEEGTGEPGPVGAAGGEEEEPTRPTDRPAAARQEARVG